MKSAEARANDKADRFLQALENADTFILIDTWTRQSLFIKK